MCFSGLGLKRTPHPSDVACPQSSWPMILLQQAGLLPHPEKPPSLPMSVATRPRATSPLSPPKPLGLGPSLHHAQDEELAKAVEQDPMLEELCKPLCCKLCNVTLNSAQQAQAHYQVSRAAGAQLACSRACVSVCAASSAAVIRSSAWARDWGIIQLLRWVLSTVLRWLHTSSFVWALSSEATSSGWFVWNRLGTVCICFFAGIEYIVVLHHSLLLLICLHSVFVWDVETVTFFTSKYKRVFVCMLRTAGPDIRLFVGPEKVLSRHWTGRLN